MCCGRDDGTDDEGKLADNGYLLAAKEIGQSANKGAQGCVGDQVANNEPDIAVEAANVLVDQRKHGAEQIQGDLRANPQKGHAHESHEQLSIHLLAASVAAPGKIVLTTLPFRGPWALCG